MVAPAQQSPRSKPLTYPGERPSGPVLVTSRGDFALEHSEGRLGDWGVAAPGCATLDDALLRLGAAPLAERVPVLAVGANACASQLRHKAAAYSLPLHVPVLPATVTGLAPSHSALVSMLGYVPATAALRQEASSSVHLTLLDNHQLMVMDQTETRYQRVLLAAKDGYHFGVAGLDLDSAYVYVSDGGCLDDALFDGRAGEPTRLRAQPDVLQGLIDSAAPLRALLGDEPAHAVARARASGGEWLDDVSTAIADAGGVVLADQLDGLEDHKARRPVRLRAA